MLRIGGVSAVLGGIIIPPSLVTRPHTDPYDPIEETLRTYAEHTVAFDLHALVLSIGLFLMLGGFIGLEESLRHEPEADAWGRLGFGMAIVATTFAIFFVILDAPVMARLADAWLNAPEAEKAAALQVAEGAYTLDTLMIIPLHLGLFFTFLFFSMGVWRSDVFHRWLGWIGIALAVIGVGVGLLALRQVVPTEPAQMRDGIVLVLLFAWFVIVGISMFRQSEHSLDDR